MTCANASPGETPTCAAPLSGVCIAFLRAFIAWLGSLAPIARAHAAAAQMLRIVFDLISHPDFDETSECFGSDARHIARYLDLADALVAAYIWLMARKQSGLSLAGNGGLIRVLPRASAPTRAALLARYRDVHHRFLTADARAQRLAARMIPSDALALRDATIPQSPAAPIRASAPAPTADAAPAHAHRAGLLERALAIVRGASPGLPFKLRLTPCAPGSPRFRR